ncbi:hypothetical protein [Pseudomonas ovata]|uniref:hypothetical protein n=1 Tax=Pseudomonas ovata TaxID=1839709 RepID=UPI000D69F0E5|nr:hypothetical protein [Pseudomonas ovata]
MDCNLQSWLIAGHLVCALDPASLRDDDIADTLLFAQCVADKRACRFEASAPWFDEHSRALRELKWINADFQSTTRRLEDDEVVTLALLTEQLLLKRLSNQSFRDIKQMMDCLSLSAQAQVVLRRSMLEPLPDQADPEVNAMRSLVLMLSAIDRAGGVSLMYMHMRTSTIFEQDFFRQPISGGDVEAEVQLKYLRLEWNAVGYESLRAKVKDFLARQGQTPVWPIRCEPSTIEGSAS